MKSMTGYGRAKQELHGRTITAELRAVNHRYLDCTVKAPRQYGFLDDAVKKAAAARIARGKVEVYIGVETQEGGDIAVTVNHAVAEHYLTALHELDQLAPFGQQFEPVTFEISGLTILQYAKMKEIYPKWQTTNGSDLIDAISFNRDLDNPHPVSWIGQLQINRFRGREKCSILVETVE